VALGELHSLADQRTPKMESTFQQLRGEQLSAVTFVQDYIQLAFDGPVLTVLMPIAVRSGDTSAVSGEEHFRNALCGQIAKLVQDVTLHSGDALTIHFEDGSHISISLKPDDYSGPEAFVARGFGDSLIVHRADD
jgi:hypothetical protein